MIYTYEQVEQYLEQQGLLSFRDAAEIPHNSVEELLRGFFLLNVNHLTITDKCHIDTTAGRRRSIGDIYRVCKTYSPNVRLEEIQDGLLDLCATRSVGGLICPDIRKRVWRHDYNEFMTYPYDEFGFCYTEKLQQRGIHNMIADTYNYVLNTIEI